MDAFGTLAGILGRHRRREALAATVRAGAWLAAGHLLLLSALTTLSVRNALSETWLHALIASYAAWLVLPVLYLRAWRRPGNRPQAAARALDHANPTAPDPFQTSLSLANHGEETRKALDAAFAAHLPRLAVPRPVFLPMPQGIALGAAALAFAVAALVSGQAQDFLKRALAPWRTLATLPILRFQVESPAEVLGIGDTLQVLGRVANRGKDQAVYAHVRTAAGEARHPLAFNGDSFVFRLGPLERDLSLHFAGANGRSPAYRVKAMALPFLESLRAVVTPPGYTRLRPDTLPPGVGNFPVLPGSTVQWLARADRPLRRAILETRDSAGIRLDTLPPGREVQAMLQVRSVLDYTLRLEDEAGIRSAAGAPNHVDLLPDHPPEIELLEPSADGTLDRDLRLPLAFRVKDDFGVTSLKLVWRLLSDGQVKDEGRRDGRDWLAGAASGLVETVWAMDSLELRPENVLEFHLVAVDNDTVNGPKSARSVVRSLRMPSIREVLEASSKQDQDAMASLKSAIQRERQLEKKLERENSGPREDALPSLSTYEINRIMVESPREHLRRTEAALGMAKPSAAAKELQELLRKSEPEIPKGNQGALPLEERRDNLEALMKAQKEQEKKLDKLLAEAAKEGKDPRKPDPVRAQLDYAAKELKRNLEAQKDLKKHFDEEAYRDKAKQDLNEQSAQEQMRLAEDMKKAVEDIQKAMEQGQKNGLLNQDMLDKMQKIQDLLKEVLPDSVQKLMEQKMAGQEVNTEELRDQMQKLLGKQGELGENLNRALAMLEQLRDKKRMQELRQALKELEERERSLAGRMEKGAEKDAALEAEQKSLQKEAAGALEDFAAQAKGRKMLEAAAENLDPEGVRRDMQEASEALSEAEKAGKGGKPAKASRSKASGAAKKAADKLAGMQASLSEALAGMENEVDIAMAHELLQESLGLSRLQLLIRSGASCRAAEGWPDDDPALYGKVAQTAGWLNERVKTFAATIPFIGSALMAEARNFHAAAQEAARQNHWEAGERALQYNQNLSRELLKLIKSAQGGGGGGEGGGSGSASGGQSGNQSGAGSQSGGGDLSGQLKGMSGKQMAINQATQQLLQAMLEGRRMSGGQGSPGGSMPGGNQGPGGMPGGPQGGQPGSSGQPGGSQGGQPGSAGEPGSQGRPGGQPGDGSQGGEGGEGEGRNGSNGRGGTMQGMGNRQGELGEKLETLAEALSEEGGGSSRKVRKLAEEARELEAGMRDGRLTPDEVRRQQERFQSRLLEAASAMEERGMSEERKAEASQGAVKDAPESRKTTEARLLQLLREARRNAKSLRLSESQRRLLDEYYESLLTR